MKFERVLRLGILALASAMSSCASSTVNPAARTAAAADAQALLESSRSPALSIAVARDGNIVWSEALGLARIAPEKAATTDSQFRIGSVTKLFTATALATLASRGAVSVDEPVTTYIPSFPDSRVTLRMLARHLSGIHHYGRSDYINHTHYDSVQEALQKFVNDPLLSTPGNTYLYSSYGYNLLGGALASATHKSFQELIEEEVLRPFGMSHTAADLPSSPRDAVVQFYSRDDTGAVSEAVDIDLSDRLPSGGYLSTASDLAKFGLGVMNLPPKTRTLLFTSGVTADGKPTRVGFAWRIAADPCGRLYVHHGGESIGGRAFLLLYPDQRVAVAIASNLSFAPIGEKDALRIAAHFLPMKDASPGCQK